MNAAASQGHGKPYVDDGILFGRLEKLVDREVTAAALFSGAYYFLEQLGFRKIVDTTL